MDKNRTIEIVEALVCGCSPVTGAMPNNDSVSHERDMIRALLIAINLLGIDESEVISEIEIDDLDSKKVLELFKEEEQRPTPHSSVGLFLRIRRFKNKTAIFNQLYGKYENMLKKGQLLDFFTQYLSGNKLNDRNNLKDNPYCEIDFFQKETFNRRTEKAVNPLKEKVDTLGGKKMKTSLIMFKSSRINHSRAYEPLTDVKKQLLGRAMEYTNDLELLPYCFQRGKGSKESCEQRLIYEFQNLNNVRNQN